MDKFNLYVNETHTLILIALMKAHGIKKVITSPGTTNISLIASLQSDSYFELYSSVDERSAAYMACGLAAESGEPVALSCTGATASRNYLPGLTEAFYRKLPVLAITSAQHLGRIGQLIPQVIDRSVLLNDVVNYSANVLPIHTSDDEWATNVAVNTALLKLFYKGGGPVHLNLLTTYSSNFNVKELPSVRKINRILAFEQFPLIKNGKIGVLVGSHLKFDTEMTNLLDNFCEKFNGVVLCDHTSNYKGKYRVLPSLVVFQRQNFNPDNSLDLLIHIGEVSGAYFNISMKEVWRVSPDGEVRDTFKLLTNVFEMEEKQFFNIVMKQAYSDISKARNIDLWNKQLDHIKNKIPNLPFSNLWIAQNTAYRIPKHSVIHFGILNSLRSWNMFEIDSTINSYSNVGGFGIDGCVSSLIGASLSDRNKLYFGFVGDLAFFYDMNSVGNRHVENNIRLMIINNGKGTEFKNYNHLASTFGDDADYYMAASGHYANKSATLIKSYAKELGFKYLSANNKSEYLENVEHFVDPCLGDYPIIYEVFTDDFNESDALKLMYNIEKSNEGIVRNLAQNMLNDKSKKIIKNILKV